MPREGNSHLETVPVHDFAGVGGQCQGNGNAEEGVAGALEILRRNSVLGRSRAESLPERGRA